ncbi:hypothetical protein [Catellatospora tritici]|uniref:hypothetical protein n=1 Tax=Catellatospora tritici TaxID=2851566 RepID=UPI001C2D270F|nr:hypothetical protein [Catellatospora tritici]MBV1850074.1 hypothetical protein [Catellatospora tritici]
MSTLDRDDELLDLLGAGGPAPDGDELAGLLAAWRTDLADGDDDDLAVYPRPAAPAAPGPDTAVPLATGPDVADPLATGPGRSSRQRGTRPPTAPGGRPVRRRPGRLLVAAAVVVVLFGGLTVAAGSAGPDSPLWPITQVVYTERADSRQAAHDARQLLDQARQALRDRRPVEAAALLEQANTKISLVREDADRGRLLTDLRTLLAELVTQHAAAPAGPSPAPTGTPASPNPRPSGATPAPSPTAKPGGLLPLPPLPSLLPTLAPILPSLLPDLPLPLLG